MNARGRWLWSRRARRDRQLRLLGPDTLIRTGPTDRAEWNFQFPLSIIERLRFRIVVDLLGERRFKRLLEIGYGSGIFLPTLATVAAELHGVDLHPWWLEVQTALASFGIAAHLRRGSVTELASLFPGGTFDAVVSVSTLEYVTSIHRACRQIRHVMTPSGLLVVVTPGDSPVLDWLLKLMTGESAEANYGRRRQNLLPALTRYFDVVEICLIPRILGYSGALYRGLALQPKEGPLESDLLQGSEG